MIHFRAFTGAAIPVFTGSLSNLEYSNHAMTLILSNWPFVFLSYQIS